MNQKPIMIILSDLHVGGGKADPGDDHVCQKEQFSNFISHGIPESKHGRVELVINGDFLEFAQVRPDVYTLGSARYWCSEDESLEKLSAILAGHENIFLALREFQEKGNSVTLVAGNHDVDLYWPQVQHEIKKAAGPILFALGEDWYSRYNGRLLIGHGHAFDPANRFKRWKNPILMGPKRVARLEMCPGTLFMVKFVNWLDSKYYFADNVKPITTLAKLIYKESESGFKTALWMLVKFAGRHPVKSLGIKSQDITNVSHFGTTILDKIAVNEQFATQVSGLYRKMGNRNITTVKVKTRLQTEDDLFNFLQKVVVNLSPDEWLPVFNFSSPSTLGRDKARTLSIVRSGIARDKEILREKAEARLGNAPTEVVVCGHTHQPDEWRGPDGNWDGGYFNPGSWTRFVNIKNVPELTLGDLEREEDFPYQLNYIRVELRANRKLRADKICYEEQKGARWALR
jgi:UDP-2,3-diacylglucosamine pyrophosphatase LpxH